MMAPAPPDLHLLALAMAASAAAAFTPGPNNMICMSIALNYGFRRAVPFSLGVTVGFPLLLAAVGAGLGHIFESFPQLHVFVKAGGAAFLLYMAWKIAFTHGRGGRAQRSAPGFWRAVAFQWINPKALVYSVSLTAAFARPGDTWASDVLYLVMISALMAAGSTAAWSGFGSAISRLLKTPRALAVFNGVMGALLAASAAGILFA